MLDKNVKAYLSAINAAAIYVLVQDGKPVSLGVAKNLDVVTRKLATRKYGWVAWGKNYDDLIGICKLSMHEKNLAECVRKIENIAEKRKVVLTPHDVVMERAKILARKIEQRFHELKSNGDLQQFNLAYKRYRFEQKKNGRTVMPYFGVMQRFRRITIQVLLEGKQDYQSAMAEKLHKEFPWWYA